MVKIPLEDPRVSFQSRSERKDCPFLRTLNLMDSWKVVGHAFLNGYRDMVKILLYDARVSPSAWSACGGPVLHTLNLAGRARSHAGGSSQRLSVAAHSHYPSALSRKWIG